MRFFAIFILLSVFFAETSASAFFEQAEGEENKTSRKLEFIDEGSKNESFDKFRAELIERLEKKDTKYLLSILDPNLKFTFGKLQDFKKFYTLDRDASKSIIWNEFLTFIKMGGVFTNEGFCASYVTCAWPDDVPMAGMGAIIGSDVELRNSPNKNAGVIATLNNEIVKIKYNRRALKSGWKEVETLAGVSGFVKAGQVRASNDYRAFFVQKNGRWVMTVYITG